MMKNWESNFVHILRGRICILFLFFVYTINAQHFTLPKGVKSDKVKFTLVNNLIIIPVSLNGVELSFILDTGVGSTILFSLADTEFIELNNATKIFLRGLGDDEPVEAVKSLRNILQIGDSYTNNQTVFMVFDESINFSPRMGFPVHGIIGYDFFKEFILDINYSKKVLTIHNPQLYTYKKCKKCFQTDLNFSNDKKRPLIEAIYGAEEESVPVNLLLDSGSSAALWLFENKQQKILVPENSFEDYLGKGFNGDVYGKKSKVDELGIGSFKLRKVTTSFPDSLYIQGIVTKNRQGSIGGGILRRFNLIVDYPNKKISFKKNDFFSKPFNYNMSGLTIVHTGLKVTKDYTIGNQPTSKPSLSFIDSEKGKIAIDVLKANLSNFQYSLVPAYEISDVRVGSPAADVGLMIGDEVISVNGKTSQSVTLSELYDLFYSEEGKKIKIRVNRLGVEINFVFYLKKVL